jgi:hypothetical protein
MITMWKPVAYPRHMRLQEEYNTQEKEIFEYCHPHYSWLWEGGNYKLGSCLPYSSTLKMEAICSSETSVKFKLTIRRYIPEDRILHNRRCKESQILHFTFYIFMIRFNIIPFISRFPKWFLPFRFGSYNSFGTSNFRRALFNLINLILVYRK